jgi:hypothetical protein
MNKFTQVNAEDLSHRDAALDEALIESFPASDPVAVSFPHAVELSPSGSIDVIANPKLKKLSKPKSTP